MKEQLAAHKALRGAEPGEPLPGKEPCVHYSSSHPLHHLSELPSEQCVHVEETTTPGRTSVSQTVLTENRAERDLVHIPLCSYMIRPFVAFAP